MKSTRALLLAAAIVAASPSSPPARAQDNDFYRGKTLNIVVVYSAGGGYDQYARLLADAKKQSLPIELFSAAESEKIVNTVYSASPDLVRRFKAVYD
jgi:hypothetical protein